MGIKKPGPGARILLACLAWLVLISSLHQWRNSSAAPASALKVAFLPITCHLLCPVAFARRTATSPPFIPVKFTAWPEMIESLRGGEIDMAFILAPIAITLRAQGVPIKIVLLGHRDGTALVVRASSGIKGMTDLSGRTVAIPIRFSTQNLALKKLLAEAGVPESSLRIVELPPPDMPSAVASGAVDAYIVGEPYAAQAELAGTGTVLHQMKDVWPGFISSVLIVREDVLKHRGPEVRRLINTFYQQASWIEAHRPEAAKISAPIYGLPAPLINYVLTHPPDRVSYRDLIPKPEEIDALGQMMVQAGLIKKAPSGRDLVDTSWLRTQPKVEGP